MRKLQNTRHNPLMPKFESPAQEEAFIERLSQALSRLLPGADVKLDGGLQVATAPSGGKLPRR